VVSDKYRGMGIASNLYRHTLKQMQISDAKILCAEIDVLPPNEPSLLFHQKFGFKELELLKHKENKVVSLQALKVN
jgi:predicted GNAT superfamily acetyltransferase